MSNVRIERKHWRLSILVVQCARELPFELSVHSTILQSETHMDCRNNRWKGKALLWDPWNAWVDYVQSHLQGASHACIRNVNTCTKGVRFQIFWSQSLNSAGRQSHNIMYEHAKLYFGASWTAVWADSSLQNQCGLALFCDLRQPCGRDNSSVVARGVGTPPYMVGVVDPGPSPRSSTSVIFLDWNQVDKPSTTTSLLWWVWSGVWNLMSCAKISSLSLYISFSHENYFPPPHQRVWPVLLFRQKQRLFVIFDWDLRFLCSTENKIFWLGCLAMLVLKSENHTMLAQLNNIFCLQKTLSLTCLQRF